MITNSPPIALFAVQQIAVDKALKFLAAARIPYAIQLPSGQVLGTLEIAVPVIKPQRKRSNDWRAEYPGYIEKIKAMEVGDVLCWSVNKERCEGFRSVVSSSCIHAFGTGSGLSNVADGRVELLRLL